MKTKFAFLITILSLSFFALSSFTSLKYQDVLTVEGIYDGHEDYGYNFIIIDEEGDERTKTFEEVEEKIFETYDLEDETFIGKKFKVTYSVSVETFVDENGYEEDQDVKTITSLDLLK